MTQTLTAPRRAVTAARSSDEPDTARQFGRAFLVELRKLVDTRAGIALIVAAVLGVGIFAGGRAAFPADDTSWGVLTTMASWPGGLAAMVLAVLLVTSEFSARTVSSTLTLQPRRGVVLAAKVSVVVMLVLAVTALALLAGALMVAIVPHVTGHPLPWTLSFVRVGAAAGTNLLTCLAALAWGLVARNAPAPIVALLVWPTLATLVSAVSPRAADALAYVSLEAPYGLADDAPRAALRLLTSVLVWVVLPSVLGVRRWLRDDLS